MHMPKVFAALLLSSAVVAGCEEGRDTTTPNRTGDRDEIYTPRSGTQTPTQSGAQGSQSQVRAQSLIEQVNSYIRDKEFDQAEQSLKELESMRSQLPQHMQTQVATLRSSLNTAKQSGGLNGSTGTQSPQQPSQPGNPQGTQNPQVQQQAQKLISEVNEHIRNQEFDEAENKLNQLEQMESQLPQSVKTQIASLRSSLDRAQNAEDGTTP